MSSRRDNIKDSVKTQCLQLSCSKMLMKIKEISARRRGETNDLTLRVFSLVARSETVTERIYGDSHTSPWTGQGRVLWGHNALTTC